MVMFVLTILKTKRNATPNMAVTLLIALSAAVEPRFLIISTVQLGVDLH